MATWGALATFRSFDHQIDGPAGWPSLRAVFSSTFGGWEWVVVFGALAGLLWWGVMVLMGKGRPAWRLVVGVWVGALLAAVALGLLDPSITTI